MWVVAIVVAVDVVVGPGWEYKNGGNEESDRFCKPVKLETHACCPIEELLTQ